jgi:hypothetical protein
MCLEFGPAGYLARMADTKYLSIYLNDHLAGSVAGVELARRAADHHAGTAEGRVLAGVRDEIEADRQTLRDLMSALDIGESHYKPLAAWALERLGRLKPNGHLAGDSPLSPVVELEGLVTGVTGKMLLWRALERSLGGTVPGYDFGTLAERAESQRERLETLRLEAAPRALAGAP